MAHRRFVPFLFGGRVSVPRCFGLPVLSLPVEQLPGGGGAGCEDTLSLVMEQGPVLSPSPSPAQPSILT